MQKQQPKPAVKGLKATGAPIPGSIELKEKLLKSCFYKMAIGVAMLSPIIMTLAQHRFGQPGTGLLVWIFFPISVVFFVLACVDYAKSKGLHPAMGLLGLGSILGLAVLSFWPDKYKYNKEAAKQRRSMDRA